jgi:hypothetical protein
VDVCGGQRDRPQGKTKCMGSNPYLMWFFFQQDHKNQRHIWHSLSVSDASSFWARFGHFHFAHFPPAILLNDIYSFRFIYLFLQFLEFVQRLRTELWGVLIDFRLRS